MMRIGQLIVPLPASGGSLDLPVLLIEWIDRHASLLRREIVPDGGECEVFATVDHDSTSRTEWFGDCENLSRWSGDDLGLEPAVCGAFSRMKLPDNTGGDAAKVADQHVTEAIVAYRATHGSPHVNAVSVD